MQRTIGAPGFVPWGRWTALLALLIGATVVGLLVVVEPLLALVAAFGIALPAILWGTYAARTNVRTLASYTRWVPLAWLALFVVSNHSFEDRSPLEAAQGTASGRTLIELAIFGLIFLALVARWSLPRTATPSIGGWLLLASWPAFALFSTFWSVIPIFTMVRSAQLFIPIALAMYVARIWRASPSVGRELWLKTLRLLVRTVTVLTILGFIFVSEWHAEIDGGGRRFNWPGVHPVEGGMLLGIVLIVVVFAGRSLTNSSRFMHCARIALFSGALFLTQTRGALVGFAAAAIATLWFSGRRQVLLRYLGVPLLVAGAWILWMLSRSQLIEYSLRGGGIEGITTFNGRIPLWELGIDLVQTAGRTIMGFGYGAPRVVLFEKVSWAGTAHNAWIELFMGIGLVGVLLALLGYAFMGSRLVKLLRYDPNRVHLSVLSLFVFLITSSVIAEITVLPGFGYSLVLFIASLLIAETDPIVAWTRQRAPIRGDVVLSTR